MLRDYPMAYVSLLRMTLLRRECAFSVLPLKGDPQVISGESGAVTTGFCSGLCAEKKAGMHVENWALIIESKVLCISTEGDTSPKTYRDVVWFGREK